MEKLTDKLTQDVQPDLPPADDFIEEDPINRAARENFGIQYLYPWQRMVIANILEAYDYKRQIETLQEKARLDFLENDSDSFCKGRQIVLLPTGAGKSLCFQIPALFLDGPTLIIYPLIALMTDQQRRMECGNLRSVIFRGGQSFKERQENFEKIKSGAKIIIANPEVLENKDLLEQLKFLKIRHIAIDEAHCVSEWGNSFRKSYLKLGEVIRFLEPELVTAFTATASPEVLKSVCKILFGGEAHIVRSESDRQNIHYYVKKAAVKKKEVLFLAKSEMRPMIVFCGTRNKAEDMAQELNTCFGSGTARFYHAGLNKLEKETTEKWFFESKTGILCSTCAYGMGIDKRDIRCTIHLESPNFVESYIQEAGRGGRDGSIAKAILLWSLEDSKKFSAYPPGSRESFMKKFAETTECRRQVLLDALGAEQAVCSGCDNCNEHQAQIQAEKLSKKLMHRELRKLKKSLFVADWEMTYKIVKKNRNFYSEDELSKEIAENMNKKAQQELGVRIWTHSDSSEVISQLKESGKIKYGGILWKDRLRAN